MTLPIFIATQAADVPAACQHFISVDGSVPGAAVTWDHHVSGEAINLDTMPDRIDPSAYDGLATTLADTDALASMVAVLCGGVSQMAPQTVRVLRSASHWCDHIAPHPNEDDATNELGARVHHYIAQQLAAVSSPQRGERLRELVLEVYHRLQRGEPLPQADGPAPAQLRAQGRLQERGNIAVFDLRGRGRVAPAAAYAESSCPIGLFVREHDDGGLAYTVGLHPDTGHRIGHLRRPLELLAHAEFAHGPPALGPEPTPGSETWGGRATVFGSPWNYGSRLTIQEVVALVEQGIRERQSVST